MTLIETKYEVQYLGGAEQLLNYKLGMLYNFNKQSVFVNGTFKAIYIVEMVSFFDSVFRKEQ